MAYLNEKLPPTDIEQMPDAQFNNLLFLEHEEMAPTPSIFPPGQRPRQGTGEDEDLDAHLTSIPSPKTKPAKPVKLTHTQVPKPQPVNDPKLTHTQLPRPQPVNDPKLTHTQLPRPQPVNDPKLTPLPVETRAPFGINVELYGDLGKTKPAYRDGEIVKPYGDSWLNADFPIHTKPSASKLMAHGHGQQKTRSNIQIKLDTERIERANAKAKADFRPKDTLQNGKPNAFAAPSIAAIWDKEIVDPAVANAAPRNAFGAFGAERVPSIRSQPATDPHTSAASTAHQSHNPLAPFAAEVNPSIWAQPAPQPSAASTASRSTYTYTPNLAERAPSVLAQPARSVASTASRNTALQPSVTGTASRNTHTPFTAERAPSVLTQPVRSVTNTASRNTALQPSAIGTASRNTALQPSVTGTASRNTHTPFTAERAPSVSSQPASQRSILGTTARNPIVNLPARAPVNASVNIPANAPVHGFNPHVNVPAIGPVSGPASMAYNTSAFAPVAGPTFNAANTHTTGQQPHANPSYSMNAGHEYALGRHPPFDLNRVNTGNAYAMGSHPFTGLGPANTGNTHAVGSQAPAASGRASSANWRATQPNPHQHGDGEETEEDEAHGIEQFQNANGEWGFRPTNTQQHAAAATTADNQTGAAAAADAGGRGQYRPPKLHAWLGVVAHRQAMGVPLPGYRIRGGKPRPHHHV